MVYGATDDYGYKVVSNRVEIYDLHATLLHQLGIDHKQLTYRFGGRDMRLTDVHGEVCANCSLEHLARHATPLKPVITMTATHGGEGSTSGNRTTGNPPPRDLPRPWADRRHLPALCPHPPPAKTLTLPWRGFAPKLQRLVREHGSPLKPRNVLRQARFPIKVSTKAAIEAAELFKLECSLPGSKERARPAAWLPNHSDQIAHTCAFSVSAKNGSSCGTKLTHFP